MEPVIGFDELIGIDFLNDKNSTTIRICNFSTFDMKGL
jgi:hypothetical protein